MKKIKKYQIRIPYLIRAAREIQNSDCGHCIGEAQTQLKGILDEHNKDKVISNKSILRTTTKDGK